MALISIQDVLIDIENIPNDWFYLPPDSKSWTLDTMGFFCDDEDIGKNYQINLPKKAIDENWIPTLEKGDIESIIDVAKNQLDKLTLYDLFNSFVFFFENDAFLQYDD